jgi:hypothetical protein
MSTCDRLDLETLGSRSVMPKNLPRHCIWCQNLLLFYCIGIPFLSHLTILTTFLPLLRPVVGIKLHEAKKNDGTNWHLATLNLIVPQKFQDVNAKAFWEGYGAPRTTFEGHFTHEPRAVTMKLWELTKKCPKVVPTHLQNYVVWSRGLKCSVKSYVIRSLTKCYFNEFLFMHVLTRDKKKN